MGSETYHEPLEQLSEETRNLHRALVTLIEELEAIDWYQQRAEACSDDQLKAVILHNRDEEIEHACMALEWLRRNSAKFDAELRHYLFSTGRIEALEEAEEAERQNGDGSRDGAKISADGSLGIGKLEGE